MSDIVVWNNVSDIKSPIMSKRFAECKAWHDDIDWICFVPHGTPEPMFCMHPSVVSFEQTDGMFFVFYHS